MQHPKQNQYLLLLEQVVSAHEQGTPAPTILVYNKEHMNTLRAGMSKAKELMNVVRDFEGAPSLDSFKFRYTPNPARPGEITITLEPVSTFQIQYAPHYGVGALDGTETQTVSGSLGNSESPR